MRRRSLLLAPLLCPLLARLEGQRRGVSRYPFEQWQKEGERAPLRWTVQIFPAELSPQQRLLATVRIAIDAGNIVKRHGRGDLAVILEVTDSDGRPARTRYFFDLKSLPEDTKLPQLVFMQDMFLLPGEYRVAVGMGSVAMEAHNFTTRKLRVAELRSDPLPDVWAGMPSVEFRHPLGLPDDWYQPYLKGKVQLAARAPEPVHIDVLMNMTPSERMAGSLRVFRRNMNVLVPALKILGGLRLERGSLDVALMDLAKQKTWEQKNVKTLDWKLFREPLGDNQPGVIDVQTLAAKAEMRQFFRDEVMKRAVTADVAEPLRVTIVLSAPVFLEHQQKLEPVVIEKDRSRRVFYLQCRALGRPHIEPSDGGGNFGGARPPAASMPDDDLERALRPFNARTWEAYTPERTRKALGEMLALISQMRTTAG